MTKRTSHRKITLAKTSESSEIREIREIQWAGFFDEANKTRVEHGVKPPTTSILLSTQIKILQVCVELHAKGCIEFGINDD